MTDIAGRFIIALILAITGLMGILILSAVASNLTLQTPQGMAIAESAGDAVRLLVIVGLPGGLFIAALLKGFGGR